jgi:hypothetical protein
LHKGPKRRTLDLECAAAEAAAKAKQVEAPDERSAIEKAADMFDIPLERHKRITVTKITRAQH